MSKELAFANMVAFKAVLDRLGVEFWLDGGTVLGAFRDKDFCVDDHNDVDFGSKAENQVHIPAIIEGALDAGFELWRHWDGDSRAPGKAQEIAIRRHRMKIDLFFYERSGEDAWALTYDRDQVGTPQVVPAHFFDTLRPLDFKGTPFMVPANTEGYVIHRYGPDYRTPIHRRQFSCVNPDQLRACRPDWKFW